jgi:cation diffusion facilitator family transporter
MKSHAPEGGHGERPIAVYGALAANLAIAVTKFVAAVITGSSAMIAEGIHSLADTGNQGLLLMGINLSRRPPDPLHPFGHGKDLYFWSLIVAVILFGLGGGMSFYEGISHLRHPAEIEDPLWNYAVLGAAAVFEATAFALAMRELLRTRRPNQNLWQAVRQSKDPTTFVVLFEDAAALTGLVVAAVGVFLSHQLDASVFDSVASMVIGTVLAAVAILLAYESRGLLMGERADPEIVKSIRLISEEDPGVEETKQTLTMHLGPDTVLLNLTVVLKSELSGEEVVKTLERLEHTIQEKHPEVTRIFIDANALVKSRAVPPKRGGSGPINRR